ncbi:MAG: transposase [Magnetococcales bacterium]|nr:transposase [Magnetococcales bacterium]
MSAAKTIKNHWDGVLNWFDSQLTSGLVEGFNSLLQAAKARARGYRTNENFIAMAYLIGSRLNFALPT